MRRYNQRIFRVARQGLRRVVEKQVGNEVRRLCIFAGAVPAAICIQRQVTAHTRFGIAPVLVRQTH